LCEQYPNEDAHTEHVTRLALQIFDATYRALRLDPADRLLLEAAARLHDIGYAQDQANHARAGADIVLKNGIAGLDENACKQVAGIICLHPFDHAWAMEDPMVRDIRDPGHMMRLAALLRVADGLDHGHIQDTKINEIKTLSNEVQLSIASTWYDGNGACARLKSDLWQEMLPLDLEIKEEPVTTRLSGYKGVVRKDDTVLQAVRRLLQALARVITDNRRAAMEDKRTEPLHDIRVALRRLVTAIDFFEPYLRKTDMPALRDDLKKMTSALGEPRDMHVWVAYLTDGSRQPTLTAKEDGKNYLQHQLDQRAKAGEKVRDVLADEKYSPLAMQIKKVTRIQIPEQERTNTDRLSIYACQRLNGLMRRLEDAHIDIRKADTEERHDFRRVCRRERYLCEFFATALGSPLPTVAKHLHTIATALGTVHDMDIHIDGAATEDPPPPKALVKMMKKTRKQAFKDFQKAWKSLQNKKTRERLEQLLSGK
jgi:CHAD domain-containing protein